MYIRIKRLKIAGSQIISIMLMIAMIMPYLPRPIRRPYQVVKMLFVCSLFLWGIRGSKRNINNLFPIILYAAALPISAIYNRIPITALFVTISDALLLCDMYLVITRLMKNHRLEELTAVFLKVALAYMVLADISAFLIEPGKEIIYFVGTKFRVSYLHWFVSVLLLSQKYSGLLKSKALIPIFFLWSFLVIKRVDCITGIVGLGAIAGLAILYEWFRLKHIFSPRFIICCILLSAVIFWSIESILSKEMIQIFITKVLGRNTALTGRLRIYASLSEVVRGSWRFGYGYQNRAVAHVVGYGNAQNGIYEIIVNYGVFGLTGFLLAVWNSCRKIKALPEKVIPFVYLLLGLTFVSIVEVSFNNYYIFALAVIYACTKTEQGQGRKGGSRGVREDEN